MSELERDRDRRATFGARIGWRKAGRPGGIRGLKEMQELWRAIERGHSLSASLPAFIENAQHVQEWGGLVRASDGD